MQPLDPLRFMLIGLASWVNEQQLSLPNNFVPIENIEVMDLS